MLLLLFLHPRGQLRLSLQDASGRELGLAISDRDLIALNYSSSTFFPSLGQMGSNLDFVFLSSSLYCIDASPSMTNSTSRRFNPKSLDWFLFRKRA